MPYTMHFFESTDLPQCIQRKLRVWDAAHKIHDAPIFGMLSTRHEGEKHLLDRCSDCLAIFDQGLMVHESLGGLEHMERPPKSFERKLEPLTAGNGAEPKTAHHRCVD